MQRSVADKEASRACRVGALIAQLDREGKEWRKFNEINVVDLKYSRKKYDYWQPVPSGLNGTVKLIPVRKK